MKFKKILQRLGQILSPRRQNDAYPSNVSSEELDFLEENERCIVTHREQYTWETTDTPIDNSKDFPKDTGDKTLNQCRQPVRTTGATSPPAQTEQRKNSDSTAVQLTLPFSISNTGAGFDSDTNGHQGQDDEDVFLTDEEETEEEKYFSDDDTESIIIDDDEHLFEEEFLDGDENESEFTKGEPSLVDDDSLNGDPIDLVGIFTDRHPLPPASWDIDDYDPDEFDPQGQHPDLDDVPTSGRVSRETRAFQLASKTGEKFDLTKKDIHILTKIYEEHGWGASRIAIERELLIGATVEELFLASEAKRVWQEHREFGCGCSTFFTTLSWPIALVLVRRFVGYPDAEVIEVFFDRLYSHWRNNFVLTRTFWPFSKYLCYRLGMLEGSLDFIPDWSFEHDPDVTALTIHPPSSRDIPLYDDTLSVKQLMRLRRIYPEY